MRLSFIQSSTASSIILSTTGELLTTSTPFRNWKGLCTAYGGHFYRDAWLSPTSLQPPPSPSGGTTLLPVGPSAPPAALQCPQPRLTASRILSEEPIPPRPAACEPLPASESAAVNQTYAPIGVETLRPFPVVGFHNFREYMETIDRHVDFTRHNPITCLPDMKTHYGHSLSNEADVRLYSTSAYIDAVRPVILETQPETNSAV